MKMVPAGLQRQYAAALREYLDARSGVRPVQALRIGRRLSELRLETLDLARIHEQALVSLGVAGCPGRERERKLKRAEAFFSQAISPLVEIHPAARRIKRELVRLGEKLNRRTQELATANTRLESGLRVRRNMEASVKGSAQRYARLLKESLESLQSQAGLRRLTHRLMAGQESDRREITARLQDEIAQTLLGIHVRLLVLRKEAWTSSRGLKNEIASTQRLVSKSARSLSRVARTIRNP